MQPARLGCTGRALRRLVAFGYSVRSHRRPSQSVRWAAAVNRRVESESDRIAVLGLVNIFNSPALGDRAGVDRRLAAHATRCAARQAFTRSPPRLRQPAQVLSPRFGFAPHRQRCFCLSIARRLRLRSVEVMTLLIPVYEIPKGTRELWPCTASPQPSRPARARRGYYCG